MQLTWNLKELQIKLKVCNHNNFPTVFTIKLKPISFTDPSVDRIKTAGIPILKKFLAGDNEVTLTINKRGVVPLGGGEITFKCPNSKFLKSIQVRK